MHAGSQFYWHDDGRFDPAGYACPAVFAREQEAVFDCAWQLIGPAEWLARPGDFVATRFGTRHVLLWRTQDGEVKVAENLCHGICGGRLAKWGCGNRLSLDCACHGWRYTPENFPRAAPGGQVREHRGLLFATLADTPPPFPCTSDAFGWHFDRMLDMIGTQVAMAGEQPLEWTVAANWKLAAQAFCGDMARRRLVADALHDVLDTPPHWADPLAYQVATPAGAALLADDEAHGAPAPRALTATLFPNISFDGFTRSLHVWNPLAPNLTEVRSFCLVSPDSDLAERRTSLRRMVQHFGPTGFLSNGDADCWTAATRNAACAGPRRPILFSPRRDQAIARNVPGRLATAESDANQRAFLAWWQQQLDNARVRAPKRMAASHAV